MATPPPPIELPLNFPHLPRHFDWKISRILDRAAFALEGAFKLAEAPESVPGVGLPHTNFRLGSGKSLDEMRVEASAWVVAGAVRDWLEETITFLERTRRMCAAVTMVGVVGQTVTEQELHQFVEKPAKDFDRRSFPSKVTFLKDTYGDVLDSRIDQVQTLVDARNCIVHRLGVVGPRDITAGQTDLVVRWEGMRFWIENPGDAEPTPATSGSTVQPHGRLFNTIEPVERRFAPGDRVTLTVQDLCDICFTLKKFGEVTGAKVWTYATTHGFYDPNPKPPALRPYEILVQAGAPDE